MPIILRLDVVMARRKVRSNVLARAIGISETNLSLLKSGKVRGLRFDTLDALCRYLDCAPGDILEYATDEEEEEEDETLIPTSTARRLSRSR
ncbi:helix-turn-helix domain-containing protein [Brevundimonas sp. SL130]|uniref:helix-turn-helix domain-containing protein n=1 Tax=Brevundimonas sp. SL130 TaxID=2995143 RepID=UPI00226CE755|nr:helix-turn-helix transcriptional regulator [Brevundimonas sp. SL130]WAC59132.1 helix-turn-helix transcriptional regulator [Brevundimonas sp. SL130]